MKFSFHDGMILHDISGDYPADYDEISREMYVNNFHVEDLVGGLLSEGDPGQREALLLIARSLARVWTERLAGVLDSPELVFYIGGENRVAIQFHLFRGLDRLACGKLTDQGSTEVYRATPHALVLLGRYGAAS